MVNFYPISVTLTPVNHFYILSDGLGSGKTTLMNALAKQGLPCMPEHHSGPGSHWQHRLPGNDKSAFGELMLIWEMRSYREAIATYNMMKEVYTKLGYRVNPLRLTTV